MMVNQEWFDQEGLAHARQGLSEATSPNVGAAPVVVPATDEPSGYELLGKFYSPTGRDERKNETAQAKAANSTLGTHGKKGKKTKKAKGSRYHTEGSMESSSSSSSSSTSSAGAPSSPKGSTTNHHHRLKERVSLDDITTYIKQDKDKAEQTPIHDREKEIATNWETKLAALSFKYQERRIDLCRMELSYLPQTILAATCRFLRVLDLSHNRLSIIDWACLAELQCIHTLNLAHNKLTQLPSLAARMQSVRDPLGVIGFWCAFC